jgi:hypothetical protein
VRGLTDSERVALRKACNPLRPGVNPSAGEVEGDDGQFESLMSRGLAYWTDYDDEWLVFEATDLGRLALRVDAFVRSNG